MPRCHLCMRTLLLKLSRRVELRAAYEHSYSSPLQIATVQSLPRHYYSEAGTEANSRQSNRPPCKDGITINTIQNSPQMLHDAHEHNPIAANVQERSSIIKCHTYAHPPTPTHAYTAKVRLTSKPANTVWPTTAKQESFTRPNATKTPGGVVGGAACCTAYTSSSVAADGSERGTFPRKIPAFRMR